jgi:hypothetical protein
MTDIERYTIEVDDLREEMHRGNNPKDILRTAGDLVVNLTLLVKAQAERIEELEKALSDAQYDIDNLEGASND